MKVDLETLIKRAKDFDARLNGCARDSVVYSLMGDGDVEKALAHDDDPEIRQFVASYRETDAAVEDLISDPNIYVRCEMAFRASSDILSGKTDDSSLLDRFVSDAHYPIRCIVAEATPNESVLNVLTWDINQEVRRIVAKRSNDQDLLASLASDECPQVRAEVASKIHDPKILNDLANDLVDRVRIIAIKRGGKFNGFEQMASSDKWRERNLAAKKTDSQDILRALTYDDVWQVRLNSVKRLLPESIDIIRILCNDTDTAVAEGAKKRLEILGLDQ